VTVASAICRLKAGLARCRFVGALIRLSKLLTPSYLIKRADCRAKPQLARVWSVVRRESHSHSIEGWRRVQRRLKSAKIPVEANDRKGGAQRFLGVFP